jgi:proteic killer suppression protein
MLIKAIYYQSFMRRSWSYSSILDFRIYTAYNVLMINEWRHKGLKYFYETGSKAGIQPKHANILSILLLQLASAIKPEDMNTPGNFFHKLHGDLEGYYSVKVNGNWRLIFQFEKENGILVDYVDYHREVKNYVNAQSTPPRTSCKTNIN